MPGINQAILNLRSKIKVEEPHYILVLFYLFLFFIIFFNRIFGIQSRKSLLVLTMLVIFMMCLILVAIVIRTLRKDKADARSIFFSDIFDSAPSRNFFTVISFMFYIIFSYEMLDFSDHNPNPIVDTVTLGHNQYISNKLFRILFVIFLGLFFGYTIYKTTSTQYVCAVEKIVT